MNDKQRLKSILERLASEQSVIEDGWRRIGTGDPKDLYLALLAEIDETVFPAALSVRNADEAVLILDAANRRLCRICRPLPGPLMGSEDIVDKPLVPSDEERLRQVGGLLRAHLGTSPFSWVRSSPSSASDATSQVGVPASALQDLQPAENRPGSIDAAHAFARVLQFVRQDAARWALFRDDAISEHGPAPSDSDWADRALAWMAETDAAAAASGPGAKSDSAFLFVLGVGPSEDRLLSASCGDEVILAQVSEQASQTLLRFWREAGL
ncbi:MAG: hypothetical protein QNJ16_17210 [Rhodobacter sp.]|nr:hypothetical protein [Rhodobacter sp.]